MQWCSTLKFRLGKRLFEWSPNDVAWTASGLHQPQEQEVGAELVLGERGLIALEVFAQLAEVTDVFFFGRSAEILEFDKGHEFA